MITLIIRRFLLMIPMLLLMSVVILQLRNCNLVMHLQAIWTQNLGQNIMKSNVKNSG